MLSVTTITTKKSEENSNKVESDFNRGNTPEKVELFGRGAAKLGLTTSVAEGRYCQ